MDKLKKNIPVAKILLVGEGQVGKSSILRRFTDNDFIKQVPTIGIDNKTKMVKVDKTEIKLVIWDTAGQEKYRSITSGFYKNAMGILLVFDLTFEESFDNIRNWLRYIRTHAPEDVYKVLIGNKCDLEDERVIEKAKIEELAQEVGLNYFEVSAKTNINVQEAFIYVAKKIKEKCFKEGEEDGMKMKETLTDSGVAANIKVTRDSVRPRNKENQNQSCSC